VKDFSKPFLVIDGEKIKPVKSEDLRLHISRDDPLVIDLENDTLSEGISTNPTIARFFKFWLRARLFMERRKYGEVLPIEVAHTAAKSAIWDISVYVCNNEKRFWRIKKALTVR